MPVTSRISTLLIGLLPAVPAAAQSIVDSVVSDLDGDGVEERFTLVDHGNGSADLLIEGAGSGRLVAADIAWIGGPGQQPELELAPNGSVRLITMNESTGIERWHEALTIAWRHGAYTVAGYTHDWYDTIDADRAGECDLNLLTGKGLIRRGQGPQQEIRHDVPSRPVTRWTSDHQVPEVCPGLY